MLSIWWDQCLQKISTPSYACLFVSNPSASFSNLTSHKARKHYPQTWLKWSEISLGESIAGVLIKNTFCSTGYELKQWERGSTHFSKPTTSHLWKLKPHEFYLYYVFTHVSLESFTVFLNLFIMATGTVKRYLNGSADGLPPKLMGQSCKIMLALNQKEIPAGSGSLF